MNIAAYPNYKKTGVKWLGDIPTHWEVRRLKFLAEVCNGQDQKEVLNDDGKYLIFGSGGPFGLSTSYLYDQPSVLLGRKGTIDKPLYIEAPFWTVDTMFYTRIESCVFPKYFFYLCKTIPYDYVSDLTTLPSMTQTGLGGVQFAFVEYEEQQQIAAFLDWKTSQIDALIAKKQTLLQKLKEKRLAVITQAVTKGLNPDAPLRDSGIAWLGEVPMHWEVKRLKFVARIGNGSTPNREDPSYWDGGSYPWLNSSVVNQEQVTNADQFVTPLALAECHLPCITPPAVLVGITGQGKTRGMATTLLFEATINQHLAYVKPDDAKAIVGFLRRVFDMAYAHLRSESENGGSTKGAITCEQIAELPIPVPPLDEQEFISERIDLALAKLARMSENAESAIARLTEYRSALITAVTTGKIDVRGWQNTAM
jgi:type I restriction enzyme S subunit